MLLFMFSMANVLTLFESDCSEKHLNRNCFECWKSLFIHFSSHHNTQKCIIYVAGASRCLFRPHRKRCICKSGQFFILESILPFILSEQHVVKMAKGASYWFVQWDCYQISLCGPAICKLLHFWRGENSWFNNIFMTFKGLNIFKAALPMRFRKQDVI